MYADVREEWRIRDVEQKAERANSRLYELDSLRSDVGHLERANGELRSEVNELRDELSRLRARLEEAEVLIREI